MNVQVLWCHILFVVTHSLFVSSQDEQISLDKSSSGGGGVREPASLAHSAYSLATSAFSSQDAQLYINGAGLSYGFRGYPGLGAAMQHPISLTTGTAAQTNGRNSRGCFRFS